MFKKLRLKFVLINVLLMFITVAVVFASVYITTSRSLERDSYMVLERVIMEQDSSRPRGPKQQINMPFIVASVPINENGSYNIDEVKIINHVNDAMTIDENELKSLLLKVADKTRGNTGDYRFMVKKDDAQMRVVLGDMTYEKSTKRNLVVNSMVIGLGALLAICIISMYLASKAIKPVEDAFDSQKRFVADASHELKTPLTVILSSTKLLQLEDTGHKNKWIENIEWEARRMKKLTDEMLYLAKAENISALAVHSKINISECIRSQVLMCEALFYEKGKSIICNVEDDLFVSGNQEQLCRLVMILLDNALKYSLDSSEIKLELTCQSRGKVKLCVENQGEIPEEKNTDSLFDRFCRADESRTDGDSYGLGLPIARTIVSAHKGKIWLESSKGHTCFYVILPKII